MKESTLILSLKRGEKERLQNNAMIMALTQDVANLQEMMAGMLQVIRRLPGYSDVIKELAAENKKKQEEMEAAEAAEALDPAAEVEEISPEDIEAAAEKLDQLNLGKESE